MHAAGDISGHRGVGEFDLLRTVDRGFIDFVLGEQLIEQQPRAGIVVAVDEAGFALDEFFQRGDLQRIAAFHHQTEFAGDEADDAVFTRVEQLLAGVDALLAQLAARQVNA